MFFGGSMLNCGRIDDAERGQTPSSDANKSENAIGEPPRPWRLAAGVFTGREFSTAVGEEGRKIREADREAARPRPT
jgi:hypothetical protein